MRKIAILLVLLTVLGGGPVHEPPSARAYQAAPMAPAATALAASGELVPRAYLPFVAREPSGCAPIPGVQYGTLDVDGLATDRPAELHADLNLALRGYEVTSAYLGLVD